MCDSCNCTPVQGKKQGKGQARAAEAKCISSHVPLHVRHGTEDVLQRGNWTQVVIQMASPEGADLDVKGQVKDASKRGWVVMACCLVTLIGSHMWGQR